MMGTIAIPTLKGDSPLPNLLAYSPAAISDLVQHLQWPRYRSQQILRWLYTQRIREIDQMTNLSEQERTWLRHRYTINRFATVKELVATDGTRKFLAQLEDGLTIESVLIPEGNRLTLCLSTQVGCTLDCGFCLTGQMGLRRNLRAHEIVDQVMTMLDHLREGESLTNLVLMGMGESLANFESVSDAIDRITNRSWGLGIAPKRITLSTAGMISRLHEVAALGVNLAVSLNAATNETRTRLMPTVNTLYPLDTLIEACRSYPLAPRQRLTFEYVLLAGINDSRQDAIRLVKLLRGMACKINVIPFNEFPGSPYKRPDDSTVLRFQSEITRKGIDVFIRKSKGREVLGACGQLGKSAGLQISSSLTPPGASC